MVLVLVSILIQEIIYQVWMAWGHKPALQILAPYDITTDSVP